MQKHHKLVTTVRRETISPTNTIVLSLFQEHGSRFHKLDNACNPEIN